MYEVYLKYDIMCIVIPSVLDASAPRIPFGAAVCTILVYARYLPGIYIRYVCMWAHQSGLVTQQ